MKNKIIDCRTKQEIKNALENKKIARINFCSISKDGEKCAEIVEKELSAEIRGVLANKKEKPFGNSKCIICNKPAQEVVYIGKGY